MNKEKTSFLVTRIKELKEVRRKTIREVIRKLEKEACLYQDIVWGIKQIEKLLDQEPDWDIE